MEVAGLQRYKTLFSLSLEPRKVTNVRVFVYRPNTDPNVLTGLVIWDPIENAQNYSVRVMLNNIELQDVSKKTTAFH